MGWVLIIIYLQFFFEKCPSHKDIPKVVRTIFGIGCKESYKDIIKIVRPLMGIEL